jgi:AsmA family
MTHRLRSLFRRWWRPALAFLGVVLLIGALAPFINAAAFRGRVERALEASLGRKVTFSAAHFTLLTGPGFSLDNVSIQEDPKYGLEPFAHVPQLDVRLRLDKLLLGHFVVASLRLSQPSLNLVQSADGAWNVVELVDRLSTPDRLINVFPAVQVSEGRIDFKFGTRKTTLYVANSDLNIYPERSGKVYIQFSGSPARTDRAGSGFGHLRGEANWYLKPVPGSLNQLEADVTLDPSNLSELTTLFEGEDAGVHGTIGSHMRIEGPVTAMRISGDLNLADVHRWDLMPSSGENWRIRYSGKIDLSAHQFELSTLPAIPGQAIPVSLELRINDFLKHPAWSFLATFSKAPAAQLLPISRRMGLVFPDQLKLDGTVDGVIGYSNQNGLSGSVSITEVVASLPDLPPIRSGLVSASISADHLHLEPAIIDTQGRGTLQVSGDYNLGDHSALVSFTPNNFSVSQLRKTLEAWFESSSALGAVREGLITGKLVTQHGGAGEPTWSGQFRFSEGKLTVPGLAMPLTQAEGRIEFDQTSFDLDRFSALLGGKTVSATYHYSAESSGPQRVHIDMPEADLSDLESALEPTLRAQGFLARLGVTRRSIPAWLASRNLRGDLAIHRFSVSGIPVGALRSHLNWQGTSIQFSGFELTLPEGTLEATGRLSVASSSPRYQFTANVTGYPWKGGLLDAQGQFETNGLGTDALENLEADGMFSGQDVSLAPEDLFEKVSGGFHFSFKNGWASLRLANLQASEGDEDWTGEAASQSDGKLIFDLESSGRQRHVVSTLAPQTSGDSSAVGAQSAMR